MVKAIMIALAATVLIAAAPAAAAQSSPARTRAQHPKISAKHHSGPAGYAARRDVGATYPSAFGYAPDPSRGRDKDVDSSRQAGGGGGGGGGGM